MSVGMRFYPLGVSKSSSTLAKKNFQKSGPKYVRFTPERAIRVILTYFYFISPLHTPLTIRIQIDLPIHIDTMRMGLSPGG